MWYFFFCAHHIQFSLSLHKWIKNLELNIIWSNKFYLVEDDFDSCGLVLVTLLKKCLPVKTQYSKSYISGFTFHLSKSIIFRRYLSFILSLKYLLSDRTAVSSDKILTRLRKPTFLLMELQLKIREEDWHRQKLSADEWNRMKNLQRHECTMCNSLIITLRKS